MYSYAALTAAPKRTRATRYRKGPHETGRLVEMAKRRFQRSEAANKTRLLFVVIGTQAGRIG